MDSNQNPERPSSINEGFIYTVTITKECELFEAEPLKSQVQNFGEMTIESNWFTRHQDCQEDAINLLTSCSKIMRHVSGRKFIIATKINPCHDDDYNQEKDPDPWDAAIVLKMFLCDSEILRNENRIDGTVTAVVRAKPQINFSQQPQIIQ